MVQDFLDIQYIQLQRKKDIKSHGMNLKNCTTALSDLQNVHYVVSNFHSIITI